MAGACNVQASIMYVIEKITGDLTGHDLYKIRRTVTRNMFVTEFRVINDYFVLLIT